jgi:hypothetical protein
MARLRSLPGWSRRNSDRLFAAPRAMEDDRSSRPAVILAALLALGALPARALEVSTAALASEPSYEAVDDVLEKLAAQLERYRAIARAPADAPATLDDGVAADSESIKACRQDLALPVILDDVKANLRYLRYSPKLFGIYDTMLHYQLCASGAAGKPLCGEIRAFERPTGMAHDTGHRLDRTCLHYYSAGALARSAITGAPDAQERCMDAMRVSAEDEPKLINLKAAGRFCSIALAHWEDPDAACALMFRQSVFLERGRSWRKNCALKLHTLIGDEAFCAKLKAPGHPIDTQTDYRSCMDYAALKKAYRAHDENECGDSNYCRRSMGAPADCAGEELKIRDWYCGRFRILVDNVKEINALFRDASAALDRAGPKSRAEWKSREEKLRGLVLLSGVLLPKYGLPSSPLREEKNNF